MSNRNEEVLAALMDVIESRRSQRPRESYTTQLFEGGVDRIGAKVLEEANELVEAAGASDAGHAEHVVHEAADLLYHALVLLAACEVSLSDVEAELARRFGVSGLVEKASRAKSDDSHLR